MEKSKKNNKRLGIVLVALLMVIAIGATAGVTLARYITTGSAQSTQATVAKWGVTITATGDKELFGEKYDNSGSIVASGTNLAVSAAKKAVAPGTKGSFTFTINGEPEVKSQLDLAFGETFTLVYLQTKKSGVESASADEYYYPIKWKVGSTDVTVAGANTMAPDAYKAALETAFVTAFKTALDNSGSNVFEAGHKFESKAVTISWAWDLYAETGSEPTKTEDATVNGYDTILGNLAASSDFYKVSDNNPYGGDTGLAYSTAIQVYFNLTLKQIQ